MTKTLSQRIAIEKLKTKAAQDLQGKPCVMCLAPSRAVAHGEKEIDLPSGERESIHVVIPVCMECIKASTIVTRRIHNELSLHAQKVTNDKSKQRQN